MHIFCPRIYLTKTHNSGRAIIPIEAISGIDEDKKGKCTKISTFDGFWYEVVNTIEDVDKKIKEAENASWLLTASTDPKDGSVKIQPLCNVSECPKPARKPVRKMLPPGVDKAPRRMAEIKESEHSMSGSPSQVEDSGNIGNV